MTFDEFEETLQDWLDEDRLADVETLIPLVRESDRLQCEELLHTYQALFAGLSAGGSFHDSDLTSTSPASASIAASSRYAVPLSSMVVALAACVTIVAISPGWFFAGERADVATVTPAEALGPLLSAPRAGTNTDAALVRSERNFVYLSTYTIEPLARSMANQTDTAFRSLGQVSRNLNPIDEQLEAYREAAPLLETLTDGFLPGSRSLSSAFSLLQETADGATPHVTPAAREPSPSAPPERSAVS